MVQGQEINLPFIEPEVSLPYSL